MKRLNAILSIALAMALVVGSLVIAQETEKPAKSQDTGQMMGQGRGMMGQGRGMMGQGHGMMARGRMAGRPATPSLLQLADKLDLSESQREELERIYTSHKKENIKIKAEIDLAKVDLQKLTKAEDPNMDEIEVLLRKIANLQVETKLAQIKLRVDSRNVLTEEQKTALKKLRQDQQAKRKAAAEAVRVQRTGPRRMRRGAGREM